jgi:asparagine synthase (glutamine-hydrolysing)
VHPQAYRGLHSGYWAAVLEEEDAGWNRINLETRAPFLDLRLLMFLLRLPPVPWCMHKELTRQAMRGQLPVEILKRPKTPLVRDLLEACQQRAGWRPEIGRNPPKMMENFVIWNSWLATLEKPKGLLSWENLYPLSLAKWLKVIENGKGIQ